MVGIKYLKYRVHAIHRTGKRDELNWDGKLDEMQMLARKISRMTGVPMTRRVQKSEYFEWAWAGMTEDYYNLGIESFSEAE